MQNNQLHHAGSRTTSQILRFLLDAIGHPPGSNITAGLPAGSMLLGGANLILGGTPCTVPLFRPAMERIAREGRHDVLVARHGMHPEVLDPVLFDAVIWSGASPVPINDLVLFASREGEYWIVPSRAGPHIRFASDGLHIEAEPSFATWHQRCEGVCRAAKQIISATRGTEGL